VTAKAPASAVSSPERAGWVTDRAIARTRVAIALGANLGDREGQLHRAVAALRTLLDDFAVSSFHDTAPVGVPLPHPNYLNAAVTGLTRLAPRVLLARLLEIERTLGRARPHANAPRTIDLDLILYGDVRLDEPALTIPHPRFRDRGFVLEPLAEIAPAMVDPVTGLTVESLLRRLGPPA
jgi:2-amino-4-hydroxy-6-hydroxymethyldihydropteridine diphosphokinase